MKRMTEAFILSVVIAAGVFSGCSASGKVGQGPGQKSQKTGNSNGNVSNWGYAVQDEDWIYFTNQGNAFSLYKIKSDGTGETRVSEDQAQFLNAYGDWIYYSNGGKGNRLYKIKLDGSDAQSVGDDGVFNVMVSEDQIYYIKNPVEGAAGSWCVFRMQLDGSGRQQLSDRQVTQFNIQDGWIYAVGLDGGIHKMKTDGTEQVQISEVRPLNFQVWDETIYYVDPDDSKLWTMRLDGSDAKFLNDEKVINMNVGAKGIYYCHENPAGGWELKKMNLDGSGGSLITVDSGSQINVAGDMLFAWGVTNENKMVIFRIQGDGTGRKDYPYVEP